MTATRADELVVNRTNVWQLAAAEARWLLRRRLLWIGVALTAAAAYVFSRGESKWHSDFYNRATMAVLPWAIVVFVLAVRHAARDNPNSDSAFSPAVPLDHSDRMLARAISLAVPVGFAVVLAVIVGVGARLEGGYWVGHAPFRTDTARHSWLELAQMPLVTFVLGAAGLALGRVASRRAVGFLTAVGIAVLVFGSVPYWFWNQPGPHAAALLQTQPLYATVPRSMSPLDFDNDWLMSWERDIGWQRIIFHRPTMFAHHVYLAAVGVALCNAAIRTRTSGRGMVAAVVVAIVAIATQIAIFPEVAAG